MAYVDCLLQVQRLSQRCKVVGVGVHVVAIRGLARPAVTTAVMRNGAITMRGQEDHLIFPGIRAQRPAMTEDHGLSRAPILVVDFAAVFGRNRGHREPPCFWLYLSLTWLLRQPGPPVFQSSFLEAVR